MNSFYKIIFKRVVLTIFISSTLTQCSRNKGDISLLSNYKLAERAYKCGGKKFKPAPGAAISCENIKRECNKRSASQGYPVC
ncbi:MAG: hypothetical protein ACI9FB_003958 [Candidatus Azotimanducaceae bacterium]|jgi:hypothetical protein